jgi:hypothetical protein
MKRNLILVVAAGLLLAGCETRPPESIVVSGNGKCHPSQALPTHKTIAPITPADTQIDPLFELLTDERTKRGVDVRDYNKLWDECVDKGAAPVAGGSNGAK